MEAFNRNSASLHVTHDEYPCGESINIKRCFVEYVDNCLSKTKGDEFLIDNLADHLSSFESYCGSNDCIELGTSELIDKCISIVGTGGMPVHGGGTNERKCIELERMITCLVEKARYRCGNERATEFRNEIIRDARGIIEACNNGENVDFNLFGRK